MGFYLCLGILTTRKRVYKFLYANWVGYFVLLQLVLYVRLDRFLAAAYRIHLLAQLPQYDPYVLFYLSVNLDSSISRRKHHMVLATPAGMFTSTSFMNCSPCSCKLWSANLFLTLTWRLFLVYFSPRHRLFFPRQSRGVSLVANAEKAGQAPCFFRCSVTRCR